MKKLSLFILLLCTLLFIPQVAQSRGWTGPVTITDIYVWNKDYVNVRISPNTNWEGCPDLQGLQIAFVSGSDTYQNRMLAALFFAYSQEKKVSFLLNGCDPKAVIESISFTQPSSY